jgi:hypothetical protein
MDTDLDPLAIMQIAEEIEYRRMRWYQRIAPRCADAGSRELCRELAAWSRQQVNRLIGMGARLHAPVPEEGAGRHDFPPSNPRLLAALAFFVAESSAPDLPATVAREWMLTDAVHRSRQAIVFYEGLKGFARDRLAKEVMDELVQQENEHLHQVLIQLEPYRRTRGRGSYLAYIC